MAGMNDYRGVDNKQEVEVGAIVKDTRSWKKKFSETMESPDTVMMILAIVISSMFVMPWVTDFVALGGMGMLLYAAKRKVTAPYRIPLSAKLPDWKDLHPVKKTPNLGGGICYFGIDRATKRELWFSNSDMRTHCLIFGSTGAGKTEALLSIAFNALVWGSGLIYVDGKGDASLFAKVFGMARRMGREDDLLIINYMTGNRDVFGPQSTKLSNTLNPFTTGSSGSLTEMVVSLMEDGGSDGMWKGRAISLIGAIMMALCTMRDNKEILLDVDQIRQHLLLDKIIGLSKRRDLPPHVLKALKAYLQSLPGFVEGQTKQSETVLDQHGYLQMQFTKVLGSLADSYGYIFQTNLGEVDFWDVVVNRRILVVLLPALEKSEPELANLGKIIVACMKAMMASGLGNSLEGTREDIIETRPTNAPTPFMTILDEYGYYAVKGAAVMPAQGRSLGFSMIFAGQDYPAFKKASPEEAASTIANCNVKVFMKLEDPTDTFELFQKSVGEAYVYHSSGQSMKDGTFGSGYADMGNIGVEKRSRGDLRDLQGQQPGQAHIIFAGGLVRASFFYADPKIPKVIRLNHFLKVPPPEKEEVLDMDAGIKDLIRKITDADYMRDLSASADVSVEIGRIRDVFSMDSSIPDIEKAISVLAAHKGVLDEQMSMLDSALDENAAPRTESMNVFDQDDEPDGGRQMRDAPHPIKSEELPAFLDMEETRRNVESIERLSGAGDSEAKTRSERVVEDMKTVTQYPHVQVSEDEVGPDDIMVLMKELDSLLDEGGK